jgi:hypothetical protein
VRNLIHESLVTSTTEQSPSWYLYCKHTGQTTKDLHQDIGLTSWEPEIQFLPQRKHNVSPLQRSLCWCDIALQPKNVVSTSNKAMHYHYKDCWSDIMATRTFRSYVNLNTCDHYKDQLVGLMLWQPEHSYPTTKKTQCITITMVWCHGNQNIQILPQRKQDATQKQVMSWSAQLCIHDPKVI